jgi:hypothetical protein
MNQFKRVQVIMLPTERHTYKKLNSIRLFNDKLQQDSYTENFHSNTPMKTSLPIQHLYLISDDEIKEGDWYYNSLYNTIHQCNNKERHRTVIYLNNKLEKVRCKKIIATTDKLLQSKQVIGRDSIGIIYNELYLPRPSQQFIEKYIESYNKGEVITDVLVEYENIKFTELDANSKEMWNFVSKLKINYKDHIITIKKLKDSWNKEEVKTLIRKAITETNKVGVRNIPMEYNKWIEENL